MVPRDIEDLRRRPRRRGGDAEPCAARGGVGISGINHHGSRMAARGSKLRARIDDRRGGCAVCGENAGG